MRLLFDTVFFYHELSCEKNDIKHRTSRKRAYLSMLRFERLSKDLGMDFDFFQRRGIRSETRCFRCSFLIFFLFFFFLSLSLIKAEVSLLSYRRGDTARSFRSESPNVEINIGRLKRRPWF